MFSSSRLARHLGLVLAAGEAPAAGGGSRPWRTASERAARSRREPPARPRTLAPGRCGARSAVEGRRGRTSAAASTASARGIAARAAASTRCSRGRAALGRASAGTPGTRLNAARTSSRRRVSSSDASSGAKSHLCGLTTIESARSQPRNGSRRSGISATAPAYAESTCSQSPSAAATSAIGRDRIDRGRRRRPDRGHDRDRSQAGGPIDGDCATRGHPGASRSRRRPERARSCGARCRASCTPWRSTSAPRSSRRRAGWCVRCRPPRPARPPPHAPRRSRSATRWMPCR